MKSFLKLSLLTLLCGLFLCSFTTNLQAGTPDLTLTSWTASPTSITVGGTINVSAHIKNIGNGTANSGHVIRYYFSTDAVLSSNDVLLGGNHTNHTMNPGAIKYVSKNVTTPSGVAANRYYCIIFVVDHTNVVAESNEANNIKSREIFVTPCYIPAKPGGISGSSSFCPDENGYYSVGAVTHATSYIWSLPSGLSGSSSTNSISVSGSPGTYTICVQASSSCGTSAQRCKTITVLNFNQCFNPCDPWRPSCGPMYPKVANEEGPTIQAAEAADEDEAIAESDLPKLQLNNEAQVSKGVSLYPNPANNTVTLQTEEAEGQLARIINMNGAIVKEIIISAPNMLLDIADLSTGVYLINVLTDKGVITGKLLKQ